MAHKVQLTLCCGDYEIVRALKEGAVEPDGIELTMVTSPDSTTRHWRFLRNREFDVAEVSSSSYIVARDQGMPFDAHPRIPAPPLPPRLRLRQHVQGHQQPEGSHRQARRREVLPGHRDPVAARHPRGRIRRAAQVHRMDHRTRRGRRFRAARGPQADAHARRPELRGHARVGRGGRGAASRPHLAGHRKASRRRAPVGPTTRARSAATGTRPASSRSCT